VVLDRLMFSKPGQNFQITKNWQNVVMNFAQSNTTLLLLCA